MVIAITVAVPGVVLVGCFDSSDSGGSATGPGSAASVPEAYPGVISPVDVDPRAAPAKKLDGRAMAALPLQKKVEHLVGKYGADSVVAMVVEGSPPDTGHQVRQRVLRAADSNAECFTLGPADRTVIYLAPVTDLDGFADRLDIGEVTVDSPKRVVLVKADAAKLTGERAPRLTRLSDLPGRMRERPPRKTTWQLQLNEEFSPDSVLVTVTGTNPKIVDAVVEYVLGKKEILDISHHEMPGLPCVFVCRGVEDIESLGELLDVGTVMGIDKVDARVGVMLDVQRVMKSAGPGAAAQFDPNSLEWALDELKSDDRHTRFFALQRVARTPPNEALRSQVAEAVKALLGGDDHVLRKDAIRTLATWGATQTVPDLVKLIEDGDIFVRQEAIWALGQLNDERAVQPLCQLLGTQREAEQALIAMGPAVEDTVLASLDATDADQFRAACNVLCDVGTKKSLDKLGPFYVRSMGPFRNAASNAVTGIRRRFEASGEQSLAGDIDRVAGALVNLKTKDADNIRSACRILVRATPDPERRQEIARALVDVANHENDFVRADVMNSLAVWYTPESLPKVIEITNDYRWHIRATAIRILGLMKTKEAIEAILDRFLKDTPYAYRALKEIGSAAEDAILRRIDLPEWRDKSRAYSIIAEIGTEKSVRKLKEVASLPSTLETFHRSLAALRALRWREQVYNEPHWIPGTAAEPATPTGNAANRKSEPRTWTDSTGKFKIEATLLDLKDGQVTLERADGRIITMPLERLNKADQNIIKRATAKPRD